MEDATVRTRCWSRDEYDRLIELGILNEDEKIELLGGHLVVREPQGTWHASAARLVSAALRRAFGDGWEIDRQLPLALGDDSEPEPDVAVVRGQPGDFRDAHPAHPLLIVEIADSSLLMDRIHKGSLYARERVFDYWIVNRADDRVEVYREPIPDPVAPFGWRYASVISLGRGETVSPLAAPDARISISDLLP